MEDYYWFGAISGSIFLTVIFHFISLCKDPGYLKKPHDINFLVSLFDDLFRIEHA